MKIIAVCLVLYLSHALAVPCQIVENEDGEAFALLPVNCVRGVDSSGRVSLDHAGTIFKNNNHRLDVSALASKQIKPNGPSTVGGQLGYSHIPSESSINLEETHTQEYVTSIDALDMYDPFKGGVPV